MAPSSSSRPIAPLDYCCYLGVDTFPEIFSGNANTEPFDVSGRDVVVGLVMRGGVFPVMACDYRHEERDIGNVVCHRPDRFQRVRVRDQAIPGDPAIRRLEPHDPAECGRAPDRAAGISTKGHPHHACRYRRCAAPGGTARHTAVSQGLSVGPNAEFSVLVPIPNSSMLVLPATAAPAFFMSSTACASYGGT